MFHQVGDEKRDIDPNPLKDVTGRFRTMSLFHEHAKPAYKPTFTLKRYDHPDGYPSMYLLYLKARDPTEYNFAMNVLGSWEHWLILSNAGWFQKHLGPWREELKVLLASEHYANMLEVSKDPKAKHSERITALKWLALNSGYKKTDVKRGRPSAEEVEGRLKQELKQLEEVQDDLERIGLTND
jgi:hypothetical protein